MAQWVKGVLAPKPGDPSLIPGTCVEGKNQFLQVILLTSTFMITHAYAIIIIIMIFIKLNIYENILFKKFPLRIKNTAH